MKFLTDAEAADAQRDALALLRVLTAGELDVEACRVLENTTTLAAAVTGMAYLIVDVLHEHGEDPAAWVARKQAGLLAAEAAG